ncbi:MAG: hypothetical protein NVS1B12_09830 [Acidimicrobiales bacterium]
MSDALDRLVADSELAPLAGLAVGELRGRRNDLQRTEQTLSYLRRLVQGRLDIVLDERQRRADGAQARDLSGLVDDLPKILAEHTGSGGGRGALPDVPMPSADRDDFLADLDRIVGADRLGRLSELSDDDLAAAADALSGMEHRVSQHRRSLHNAIDAFQEEIVRRYKSGEASVDALLP